MSAKAKHHRRRRRHHRKNREQAEQAAKQAEASTGRVRSVDVAPKKP